MLFASHFCAGTARSLCRRQHTSCQPSMVAGPPLSRPNANGQQRAGDVGTPRNRKPKPSGWRMNATEKRPLHGGVAAHRGEGGRRRLPLRVESSNSRRYRFMIVLDDSEKSASNIATVYSTLPKQHAAHARISGKQTLIRHRLKFENPHFGFS